MHPGFWHFICLLVREARTACWNSLSNALTCLGRAFKIQSSIDFSRHNHTLSKLSDQFQKRSVEN